MDVLVVDVGGSNVKLWTTAHESHFKIETGPDFTATEMAQHVQRATAGWDYDVVALGLPCRIIKGRPVEEPGNLGNGWLDLDYDAAFGKPVRIMNDAALQALGSYCGGRMLFIGLGTSIGSTLIADRTIVPLNVGILLHGRGKEIWRILRKAHRKEIGHAKWQAYVEAIVPRLRDAFFAEDMVIGGGMAEKLDPMPEGARRGDNQNVLQGGMRLWHELPDPVQSEESWRIL